MSCIDSVIKPVSQSDALVFVDKICDYVPFLSIMTNICVILKKIEMDWNETKPTADQHYYLHIQEKDYVRCVLLLIPVIGNIAIAIFDIQQKYFPSFLDSLTNIQLGLAKIQINFSEGQLKSQLESLARAATSQSGIEVKPEELKFAEGKYKDLSDAIKSNDVTKVQSLLSDNVDPNIEELGRSHFINACRAGALDICKLMLPKIPDINALDKFGDNSLIQAAKSGNADLVEFLLENGADPSIKKHNGRSAIFAAVEGKNILILDRLLELSRETIFELRDSSQGTLLFYCDDVQMIATLLERLKIEQKHEFLNVQGKFGFTVLHEAIRNNKLDVAVLLLDSGANPFIISVDEDLVLSSGSFSSMKFIDGKMTPFMMACENGHLEFVQKVISQLADTSNEERNALLNMQTKPGSSALHFALIKPKDENGQALKLVVANLLLDAGANPFLTNSKESSPLMLACEEGHSEFVLKIRKMHGWDQEIDQKLLEICAHKNHLELLHELLSITLLDDNNPYFSELMNSLCNISKPEKYSLRNKIIMILLSKGADVNYIKNKFSSSCLVNACKQGANVDFDLIELLLDKGADANSFNEFDRQPIIEMSLWYTISEDAFPRFLPIFKRLLILTDIDALQKSSLKEIFECRLHKYSEQAQRDRVKKITNLIDERLATVT